jgi:hypothetical protein
MLGGHSYYSESSLGLIKNLGQQVNLLRSLIKITSRHKC